MLRTRFSRFLLLILISGALLGVAFLIDVTGLVDEIFPHFKDTEGFAIWMPLLPPIAVCIVAQLFGDVFTGKILDSRFFLFIKRIVFLAVAILSFVWYIFSYDKDYSIHFTDVEIAFMDIGLLGPMLAYLIYVLAYVFWTSKWTRRIFYPFYLLFAVAASMVFDYLLVLFWPDGAFWIAIALIALPIIIFFTNPYERLFERHNNVSYDSKKIAKDLAYLNDPNLRPYLDRDYDENGHYFGACCANCAYCKKMYDKNGFIELYCARTKQSCQEYESCDGYKRAK